MPDFKFNIGDKVKVRGYSSDKIFIINDRKISYSERIYYVVKGKKKDGSPSTNTHYEEDLVRTCRLNRRR